MKAAMANLQLPNLSVLQMSLLWIGTCTEHGRCFYHEHLFVLGVKVLYGVAYRKRKMSSTQIY